MGVVVKEPPRDTRVVRPAMPPGYVRFDNGDRAKPPEGWALLPPGDALVTRRVKAAGPSWTVKEKKGRKEFSRGVWAPAENIERAKREAEEERADPAYQRRLEAGRRRREQEQAEYVVAFRGAVLAFLAFHPRWSEDAERLADVVTAHAVPVGSGTVARTSRIPIEQRAEAAVIAWMRHQTTAYDSMRIERVKGRRREVRAELARVSRRVLDRYRRGEPVAADCPLRMVWDG